MSVLGSERLIAKYGEVTVIALALVWWLASDVSGTVRGVREDLREHILTTNYYLKQICLNGATSDVQRYACIPPEERR